MSDRRYSWELVHALSERILRSNSATEELERWCRERAIGDGRIVALCARDATPEPLDDESLEVLYPRDVRGKTRFRRVRLATSGIVVVDALNWYFPNHLTPEICKKLEKSDIPFGRAIEALKPKRRTFLVRRCAPDQLVDVKGLMDRSATAFEHRAVVQRHDGAPLAVVHERFRFELLSDMPAPVRVKTFQRGLRPSDQAGPAVTLRVPRSQNQQALS
jgi:chorismate-pyruvate lyase